MADYIILRDLSRSTTAEPFAIPGPSSRGLPGTFGGTVLSGILPGVVPAPKLSVENLSRKDVTDAARDSTVVALARPMPTRLIEPKVSADAAAVEPAWGIRAVLADQSSFDGAGVRIAVLDTGIDANHAAFSGVNIVQQDFSGDGNGDGNGHGTHCAGTIFGRDVDGTRIGVARGVGDALIGKVLSNSGGGDSEMLFRGIQWAADKKAHVISMSLGFDFPGLVERLVKQSGWPVPAATSAALEAYRSNLRMFDRLMDLIQAGAAFGTGTVVVAAAGNESERDGNPSYEIATSVPAAANHVISVGALRQNGSKLEVAGFSNTFPNVSAPGVNIVSAKAGGGLHSLSGTSMACPHVAGVAALWWQQALSSGVPKPAENVRARVLVTSRLNPIAAGVDRSDLGEGIVTAPTAMTS